MVSAFAGRIKFDDWPNFESRVERNTYRVLDLLDEFSIKATFFVLGWVAERYPSIVREIDRRGHEIACHGYKHELIYNIGPEKFREDVHLAKKLLQDVCGKKISGYRAPSYSIIDQSLWALDILIEEGFTYDSSIFPIRHDIYGMPGAERFPYQINRPSGKIHEFPLSTVSVRIANRELRVPVAGGGYLRLFPVWFVRKALSRINEIEGRPAIVYFHPWETDPDQPRIKAGLKSRFRHYVNLDKTMSKVRYLLTHLQFAPVSSVLSRETVSAPNYIQGSAFIQPEVVGQDHVHTRTS
jgi:polysaccharide deacetylase family protein (PEP-CTERM system associated)